MLRKIENGLWVADQNLKALGIELGARMTVVDLDGKGRLLIHSPIQITEILKNEIENLGSVEFIIAPNLWHYLFAEDCKNQFKNAKLFCAPGLDHKRPDLPIDGLITADQVYDWNPAISHHVVQGIPKLNEVVLYHPATKTLITTDLVIHICHSESFSTRFWLSVLGIYKKFGWSAIERAVFIKNKKDYRQSIESILKWDIQRVIMSHGQIVDSGGREKIAGLLR